MDVASHLVQMSTGVTPDTRNPRTIVMDEDAWRRFIYHCYLNKYGPSARKLIKKNDPLTYGVLKLRCSQTADGKPKEDTDYHLPDRNTIRLWGRQVLWNLLYAKNGSVGQPPNPFEMYDGLPYYPYVIDEETKAPKMVDVVCARQKPVDEVMAQYLVRNKLKNPAVRTTEGMQKVSDKQRKVIEQFERNN